MANLHMKAQVIFPDGSFAQSPTWGGLEYRLRQEAWNPTNSEKFRKVMANRARVWSGTPVDVELISRQFFEDLEAAKLLIIVRDELR